MLHLFQLTLQALQLGLTLQRAREGRSTRGSGGEAERGMQTRGKGPKGF